MSWAVVANWHMSVEYNTYIVCNVTLYITESLLTAGFDAHKSFALAWMQQPTHITPGRLHQGLDNQTRNLPRLGTFCHFYRTQILII